MTRLMALLLIPTSVASCALLVSFDEYERDTRSPSGPRYGVSFTVDGLAGATVALFLNGGNRIECGNGRSAFEATLAKGDAYSVTVKDDPLKHRCFVFGGDGMAGSSDVSSVEVHCVPDPASIVASPDEDVAARLYAGVVTIGKAPDETNVSAYEIHWANDTGEKLLRIATLPKTGSDLVHRIEAPSGALPNDTSRIVAVSVPRAMTTEKLSSGVSTGVADNYPVHVDLSAGQAKNTGIAPAALIDAANQKLLVVTQDGSRAQRPGLFRCNLNGTGCAYADVSAGQGESSGLSSSAVIDDVNGKLLVVSTSIPINLHSALFRCELDGTGCLHTDISAGQGPSSGRSPAPVIDRAAGKLLVATTNATNRLSLFRCNLDGTACVHTDISVGQGAESGSSPTAMIDVARGKLLVVTRNGANVQKPSLFRCNLDGTSCTHTDISAGQAFTAKLEPSAVIDVANDRLLVAVTSSARETLGLVRCNLDDASGASCVYADVSAGQPNRSGLLPSAAIDTAHGKLLVATTNGANQQKPSLFRCNLDGSLCSHTDLSAGQGDNSGVFPTAIVDATSGRLLVVTQNDANQSRPSLFTLGLW